MAKISLPELKARVEAYASDCWDQPVKSTGLAFAYNPSEHNDGDYLVSFQAGIGLTQVALDPLARIQVSDRLDAPPVEWLYQPKSCPPALAMDILNKLAGMRPVMDLLVRAKGQAARAVVSGSYSKFDNTQLVDLTAQAIATMGDVQVEVHRPEIGDTLRAYILLPQITFGDIPEPGSGGVGIARPQGDPNGKLHPAIYIHNNEVGLGRVKITGGLFQGVCTNGTIYGWKSTGQHSITHRFISETAMGALVADMIAQGLSMSEEAALAFVRSQDVHIQPVTLKPILSGWIAKYGLSVSRSDNWLAMTLAESASRGRMDDPRAFDVVNGATYLAQTVTNTDEREILERMAGDFLAEYAPAPRVAQEE